MSRIRPPMRYHGGKWRLAPRIIAHFPPHRRYVEPYGGGAGVLMRKSRDGVACEVYNDLCGEVVNVFKVLQNPLDAATLRTVCELTPFARTEFMLSYERSDDRIEQARRTVFRSFGAYGTTHMRPDTSRTGFRASQVQRNSCSAADWRTWPANIPTFVERLRGIVIECKPAVSVIRQQDKPDTLFYLDPPYPRSTRSSIAGKGRNNGAYTFEMTDDDHRGLALELRGISGMAIVSGYACDLYDRELYPDWHRVELPAIADRAKPRIEVLWINPAAAQARAAAPTAPAAASAADQRGGMSRVARPQLPSASVPSEIPG